MKRIVISICSFLCLNVSAQQYAIEPCESRNSCCDWACHCNGDCCLESCNQAYNIPASALLDCSWGNIVGSLSWIYWHASEEGLDLATTMSYSPITNLVSVVTGQPTRTVYSDFDYHSGFKLGLGSVFGCDSWVWHVDWTRFHHRTNTSRTASDFTVGTGALSDTNWFYQVSIQNQVLAAESLRASWDLDLDWIDVTLARPFYEGMCLTLNPFAGLRVSLIKQTFDLTLVDLLNVTPPSSTLTSHNRSRSWAIGPRAGVDTHYLLGWGFRLQAEVGGSLLYTRYTTLDHSEDATTPGAENLEFGSDPISVVRPMLEANLGIGWGWCPASKSWHFDFSATYDFNHLWSQNMMRASNDWIFIGSSASPADLSMHGLTLTATVQF